jgi:hypothetical protein
VRSLFRGAALNDSVEASTVAVPEVAPEAAPPQPTWTPPALSYPPIVGYNQGVPPSMAALAIQGQPASRRSAPVAAAAEPDGHDVDRAFPASPRARPSFTNDDLVRLRGQGAPGGGDAGFVRGSGQRRRRPVVSNEAVQDKVPRVDEARARRRGRRPGGAGEGPAAPRPKSTLAARMPWPWPATPTRTTRPSAT